MIMSLTTCHNVGLKPQVAVTNSGYVVNATSPWPYEMSLLVVFVIRLTATCINIVVREEPV